MGDGEQSRQSRRDEAAKAAIACLPADISFLTADLVSAKHLGEAAEISRAHGQNCASEILIARGYLDRSSYEARLAAELGAHYSCAGPDSTSLADGHASLDTAAVIAETINGRRLFVAPHTAGYLAIAERALANPDCFRNTVFCSAMSLRTAIFDRRKACFLDKAIHGLQQEKPEFSAFRRVTKEQSAWAFGFVLIGVIALIVAPAFTLAIGGLLLSLFYLAIVLLRSMLVAVLDRLPPKNAQSSRFPTHQLPEDHPVYSIMVALYDEAGQVEGLIAALDRLDWPITRREILLVCEQNDRATIEAIGQIPLPSGFNLVICPHAEPKTKPKALAFALPLCSGKFCVVYDAEDRPHPSQLREAWAKFQRGDSRLACLQAPLTIHNHGYNWLTAMFAIEYQAQFLGMLPALEYLQAPIPLGGTSNHFRTAILRELGGWDPYNVTEDADLGIRIARFGYQCGTISAPTFEEAPPVLNVWLKQRTRWLKGWLQTVLVHTRNPLRTRREMGLFNTIMFHLLITAIVISMLIHPAFVILTFFQAISLGQGNSRDATHLWITGLTFFNLAAGYTTYAALVIAVRHRSNWRKSGLYLLTLPAYWLLISIAGWRALLQLVTNPFKWEKTAHGLSKPRHNANMNCGVLQAKNPAGPGNRSSESRQPAP